MFGPVFLGITGIIAWIALALWPAFIAKRKGHSFLLFLLLGIVTSFLISLVVALVVKDLNETPESRAAEIAAEKAIERETNT